MEFHDEFKRGGRLGPSIQDDKEATALKRVTRGTPHGLEYGADPRQAEKLLEAMDLDGANSIATPRLKPLADQIERQENSERTRQGEKKDDHQVVRDPPTPARSEPFVQLLSVVAKPIEPVTSVRIEPSTSSNAPVVRPNYIDNHRDMGAR